jgi:hypothetical protein
LRRVPGGERRKEEDKEACRQASVGRKEKFG